MNGSRHDSGPQTQLQSRLRTLRSDMHGIRDIIDQAHQHCTSIALDLAEHSDTTPRTQDLDQCFRRLIDHQQRLNLENTLLGQLVSESSTHPTEDFHESYQEGWQQATKEYEAQAEPHKYGGSEKYLDFRQQLWDVGHDTPMPPLFDDQEDEEMEDLVVAGARITFKCPITATWLTRPLTSMDCGHSFSGSAITEYLRAHSGACGCPVAGCAQRVSRSRLKDDRGLERRVQRHLRQLEAQEEEASYTMVQ